MKTTNMLGLSAIVFSLAVVGCGQHGGDAKKPDKVAKKDDDHEHGPGPHGGTIIEFGKGHAEFTVDHRKELATVYILDESVKKAVPITAEKLLLSIKNPQFQADLMAAPMDGDPKGKSSRFVGKHEKLGVEQEFEGTVSGEIEGKPYLGDFKEKAGHDKKQSRRHDDHPKEETRVGKVDDAEENQLFLKPGGIYTAGDIKANGETVASVKYKSFKAAHDLKPKSGDRLCPITLTKANPALTWVISGKKYEFCCLPCVGEYVKLAKEKPSEVKPPEAYIKK